MTSIEPQPAAPPPSPRFQFTLRTLLLLFVVLGSSLAVFGAWGIVVFVVERGEYLRFVSGVAWRVVERVISRLPSSPRSYFIPDERERRRTVSVLQVSPSPPASPCCLRAAFACSPTLGDDEDRRRRAIGCFASQLFPRQTRHDGIDCVHGLVKPCTVVPLGASAIHLLACVAKATAPLAPPLALCAAVQRSNPALDLASSSPGRPAPAREKPSAQPRAVHLRSRTPLSQARFERAAEVLPEMRKTWPSTQLREPISSVS